jgi:hypothetical protein
LAVRRSNARAGLQLSQCSLFSKFHLFISVW